MNSLPYPDDDFPDSALGSILVADDEPTNLLLIRGFLRGTSIRVLEASNGQQAVELWNQNRPGLVLMDLRMPGLTGIEAARLIRALDTDRSTRLVAMSAMPPSDADLAEGLALWSGYLEKPFHREDIFKFLSKHLTIVDDSAKSS